MTLPKLKDKLLEPRVVLAVWMVMSLYAAISKALGGAASYNNFLVFRGVADHLFASLPLYEPYPAEYGDLNHYGPVFGFLVAPFAVIPTWLAVPLWIVSMSVLLYWAVRKLPLSVRLTSLVLWIALNDLYCAELKQQFNIASAALLVGTFTAIERRREGWAALFIVLGTFVKIYGIVGLAFFFFVHRKGRFIGFMALWSLVALLSPLLVVSPQYLVDQYVAWAVDIAEKGAQNMFALYQNVSFVGVVRKISGSTAYSDLLVIAPAMVLFLLSYLRISQYKRLGYRLVILASLLLFVVLFSNGSETSGYILAAVGVGIWWVTIAPDRRNYLTWTLLALTFVATLSRNIFPRGFYDEVITAYALRALPYMAVWLHCIWRLWREDFADSFGDPKPTEEAPCAVEERV